MSRKYIGRVESIRIVSIEESGPWFDDPVSAVCWAHALRRDRIKEGYDPRSIRCMAYPEDEPRHDVSPKPHVHKHGAKGTRTTEPTAQCSWCGVDCTEAELATHQASCSQGPEKGGES